MATTNNAGVRTRGHILAAHAGAHEPSQYRTFRLGAVLQVVDDVRGTVDSLSSTSEELSATAQGLSLGTGDQATSAGQTSVSVAQMSVSITRNTDNAQVTDGITARAAQSNTTASEKLATTADEMGGRAEQLPGLMAFFKLSAVPAAPAPAGNRYTP